MINNTSPSRLAVTFLLVAVFAVPLKPLNGLLVHGLVVPSHRQATPIRPRFSSVARDPWHNNNVNKGAPSFGAGPVAVGRGRNQKSLQLEAIPPSVWWILGHTTLPFFGIPFVINGTREGGWYRKIDLPPWTPPDALFGPVWTFLYTCMGLAISRIARLSSSPPAKNPLVLLWVAHFCLNVSWAPVFFGLQRFRLGLFISYGLVGSLAVIGKLFYAVDPASAFLLVPYALWLSFATFGLNVAICRRNPTKNGYNEGMFQAQLIKLQEEAAARIGWS